MFFNRRCRLSKVKDNINPISEEWCRLSRVKDNIIFPHLFPFRTHAIKVYVACCYDTQVNFQLSISVHCLRECVTLENRRNHVNFLVTYFSDLRFRILRTYCTDVTPVGHFAKDDFCIRIESKKKNSLPLTLSFFDMSIGHFASTFLRIPHDFFVKTTTAHTPWIFG